MPILKSEGPLPPALWTKIFGVVFDLLAFILQLFGFGSVDLKPLETAVNGVWQNVVQGAAFLYNQLHFIESFLVDLITSIAKSLYHILDDLIHGHILTVIKDIQALFHTLKDLFGPILQFIAKLHAWFMQYIYPWIRLAQEILSRIRVVLALFRLLGQKWAAKLDADIQKIQGYLTTALQDIVATLNTLSTVVNVLVDPFQIIRKDFFTGTLFSSLGAVKRAVGFGGQRALTVDEQASEDGNKAMINGGAAVLTRNADGTLQYSPAAQAMNRSFADAQNYYGFPASVP